MAKTILIKNRAERIMLIDFRLYYKATVINKVMYHSTGIKPDNRIESPEIKSYTYGQLIYDKRARKYNGKKTVSLISGAGKTRRQLHVKE